RSNLFQRVRGTKGDLSPFQFPSQQTENQSRRGESNPRPTHYECVALPLSYFGVAPHPVKGRARSEEHTSELQSRENLVCRLLLASPNSHSYTLSLHDALPI